MEQETCAKLLTQLSWELTEVKWNKHLFFILLETANVVFSWVINITDRSQSFTKLKDLEAVLLNIQTYKGVLASLTSFRYLLKEGLTKDFNSLYYALVDIIGGFEAGYLFSEEVVTKAINAEFEELLAKRREITKTYLPSNDEFLRLKLDGAISNRLYQLKNNMPKSTHKNIPLYEIEELQFIGAGGFGKIYKGKYNNSHIAVKFLPLSVDDSEDSLVNFAREIQIISKLQSPFVVEFLAADPLNLSFVMEYLELGSLSKYLENHKESPIPWHQKIAISSQIAKGLQFLHLNKVFHCDLKPENILLSSVGQRIDIKITDFGFSLYKQKVDKSAGTIQYMAPELFALAGEFSVKSDIYALGVVFWEIALHRKAYAGKSKQNIIDFKMVEGSLDAKELTGEQPLYILRFAQLISCCTYSDPKGRYPLVTIIGKLYRIQMQCFLIDGPSDLSLSEDFKGDPELKFNLLHEAALIGVKLTMERLINKDHHKCDINSQTLTKFTPLYIAAFYGHVEVVKLLLENNADMSIADSQGNTPLLIAAHEGHVEVVQVLLQHGADMNASNKAGETPIFLATYFKHIRVVEALIDLGADIHSSATLFAHTIETELGKLISVTELKNSLRSMSIAQIKAADKMTHILHTNFKGPYLTKIRVQSAVKFGNLDFAKKYEVFVRKLGEPLNIAIEFGQAEFVSEVMNGNWFRKSDDSYFESTDALFGDMNKAFETAIKFNQPEIIEILFNHGIGTKGEVLQYLEMAATSGSKEALNVLLRLFEPTKDMLGRALIVAAKQSQTNVMQLLIDRGVDIDYEESPGSIFALYPLLAAVSFADIHTVEFLLQNGANVNKMILGERCPLEIAAIKRERRELIELLLRYGADINLLNNPLDIGYVVYIINHRWWQFGLIYKIPLLRFIFE